MTKPPIRVLCYIGSMDAGGAERQVVTILQHLDRTRFVPVVALAIRKGSLLSEVPADVPVVACLDGDQPTPWNHRFGLGRLTRWRWLARIIRDQRIDVVYDRTYLATLDAAPATWRCGVPRISAAVADPAVQFAMYARRPKTLWRSLCRWAYQSAEVVLANSEGLRQQLIAFWRLPAEHVRVQPNAYDFARIDALSAEPLPTTALDRFRMLTVGRIDADKGHADLLSAVDRLVKENMATSLLWQIIGVGPDEAKLRQRVQELGLTTHVEFLGPQANPFPYYRAADSFCLPSRTEGFPNVLVEALACGTPVISTDCPSGPREILADGAYGRLVPVRNPQALAAAIKAHIVDPTELQSAAQFGSIAVRQRFAAAVVVRQLETLIEATVESARSAKR